MTLLWVGLQVITRPVNSITFLSFLSQDSYPKCGQEWDEDDSSDLVNRLGKILEEIGQLDQRQMAEVLERAKWAGFARWHMLATLDGMPFSSTYRNNCHISFTVLVGFRECVRAADALLLDKKHLAALVRRFGADLEQLRKLTRPQLRTVAIGLECAGFVDEVYAAEAVQNWSIPAPESTITGAMQPAPFLPPQPPYDLSLSTHDALTALGDSQPWISSLNLPDDTDSSLADLPLLTNKPSESASSFTEPILDSDPNSCFEMTSPVTAHTPGNGAPFRSSPLDSYPSPGESELPGSETHTMIAPHAPIILPNVDEGASYYPTPPSYGNEVSNVGEQSIRPESGRLMASQTENMDELVSTNAGDLSVPVALNYRVQNVKRLLFSCDATLNDFRVQRILHVSANPLIAEGLEQTLWPLLGHWNLSESLDVSALGLPVQWRGIGAAANYLKLLDSDGKPSHLNPIAVRLGQVLLYFNYEDLCRNRNKLTHRTSDKADKTGVLNNILEVYQDDPLLNKGEQVRRNRVTGYHLRRGKWWWRIAGTVGVGILLLGNTSLVHDMCIKSFTDAQLKAFVTLSLKTQPGSKRVFEATESMVQSLIFGHVTHDPYAFLFNNDGGLLRPEELVLVRNEDEQALLTQLSQTCWEAVDIVKNARRKMVDYLGWESDK
ncbi:hypothetical protein N7522_002025 [Penicillium canescens]|uniref:Uncharacterized protein n=1 Tax=Penicillium canescens TaxID=5083 RepID=A0AAD6I5G8_PENCN|nr:uncharacterized protein N7446_014186 [Penicillium canescens]KAJ6018561.1 hypothetical protein N7522_002025 [Penicillium canescens]KAJ6034171.1 hypothetical protein N7460_009988 [Penicillium canescens]KAJ6038906.1 hypothetical protein N7446_014186 [Penicillium canescens]KAJ6066108.1 hypothetical protein N7444_000237 [Penicillium canescens]